MQYCTGYGATDYQGLSAMGQFEGIGQLIRVLLYSYYEFVQFLQTAYISRQFTPCKKPDAPNRQKHTDKIYVSDISIHEHPYRVDNTFIHVY